MHYTEEVKLIKKLDELLKKLNDGKLPSLADNPMVLEELGSDGLCLKIGRVSITNEELISINYCWVAGAVLYEYGIVVHKFREGWVVKYEGGSQTVVSGDNPIGAYIAGAEAALLMKQVIMRAKCCKSCRVDYEKYWALVYVDGNLFAKLPGSGRCLRECIMDGSIWVGKLGLFRDEEKYLEGFYNEDMKLAERAKEVFGENSNTDR